MHDTAARGTRARLRTGRPHLAVEYRWTGRELTIGVWVPGTVAAGPVAAAVRAAWPGATAVVTDPTDPIPATGDVSAGVLAPAMPSWYPLRTDHDNDPMRALVAAATGLHGDEYACVQVLARPAGAPPDRAPATAARRRCVPA